MLGAHPEDTITGYITNLQEANQLASNSQVNLPDHVHEKELQPLQLPSKRMQIISSTHAFVGDSTHETGAQWKEKIFEVKNKLSQYFNLIVDKAEAIIVR